MLTTIIAFSALTNTLLGQPTGSRTWNYMREDFYSQDSSAEREKTLLALIKALNERYVIPEVAKKIEGELTKWMKTPEFAQLDDPEAFAQRVNEILAANVTDAHLRFRYSAQVLPERKQAEEPSPEEIERFNRYVRRQNANFRAVERLEGNIGYLAFDGFTEPEDLARPMAAAMEFLQNTDAMIIDLRSNGGGSPSGVQVVCSYFFPPEPVLLNRIYFRRGDKSETFESWTLKDLPAPRFLDKPLYILVGKRTGSGAEECAYNFQQLHRGTIIGEPTWGGANPGGTVRIDDHHLCFIPVGRAENPYTKTNWEGTGVIPDIRVNAEKAKTTAQILILKELAGKETDPDYKSDLESLIQRLESGN
ncbi:MAG: S41 family peptidase [Armatimonadetes bacterium]|nr:S41 family peptidase [Armatimonadota bacterium]MBS1712213.1 S41 family peptidase [Armatimonadota bacterium]MBX3107920.1 S41 family peptidase [Fimbriimonadaceae bacterium]